MTFLEINGLTKLFGGLAAVTELDISVDQGKIFGLIGPNGAGKSTVLNMISGTIKPTRGRIVFNDEEITNFPSHRRAQRGIGRVFQEDILFENFSALENVKVGLHLRSSNNFADVFFRARSTRIQEKKLNEIALSILEFVGLKEYSNEFAVNLPHGRQRLLSLAIALAIQPQLLLLDEPLTGMNPKEIEVMLTMIRSLREQRGITCMLIEHNLKAVMGLCDRIAVLNFGKKIAEGSPEEIVENQTVIEAYLGTEEDDI